MYHRPRLPHISHIPDLPGPRTITSCAAGTHSATSKQCCYPYQRINPPDQPTITNSGRKASQGGCNTTSLTEHMPIYSIKKEGSLLPEGKYHDTLDNK
mmetsp:Transcript_30835/g.75632  ORF Transcript_30835/g.75632 Transcript_30835/m.75632 type:complete len:98 (+) Transcript_30835:163-456(+)